MGPKTKKIGVYGSLKKGAYNHQRFALGEPIAEGKVRGAMFLMYTYPHLYRSGFWDESLERDHTVEVYEVDEATYHRIQSMEIGAGYEEVPMEIGGHQVSVFFSRNDIERDIPWIGSYTPETVPAAFNQA